MALHQPQSTPNRRFKHRAHTNGLCFPYRSTRALCFPGQNMGFEKFSHTKDGTRTPPNPISHNSSLATVWLGFPKLANKTPGFHNYAKLTRLMADSPYLHVTCTNTTQKLYLTPIENFSRFRHGLLLQLIVRRMDKSTGRSVENFALYFFSLLFFVSTKVF